MVKFLRRTWNRYVKLGKGRKKKQKWRNPTGRDNKMREKRKGYPVVVSIGYKKPKKLRETIENKNPILIMNIKDLEKIGKNEIAIVGKIGKKKKIELAKKAKEMKIEIHNLNVKKFLKNIESEKEKAEIESKKTKKEKQKDAKEMKIKEAKNES
jgi:large subunit ribosomal protein L32e